MEWIIAVLFVAFIVFRVVGTIRGWFSTNSWMAWRNNK